jgi:hypothetical protein
MMSFFSIPKGVLKKLDYFRSRFFWQQEERKKYRLGKWNILCQPKDQGGLGILDLDIQNTALLSKWLYKLLTSDETWQQLIRNKYLHSKPLSQAFWKLGDSHFWAGLMKVKQDFLCFGTFTIKNGSQIRFWEDIWLGTTPLRDQYPCLYYIARHKQVTVADVFSTSPLNLSWRRDLIGPKLVAWNDLLPRLANVIISDEQDGFRWNLVSNGQFSVKSHYLALIHVDVPNLNKRLWKLKACLKIKIFLWYLRRGVILTKDNLAKRNWHGNVKYCFCHKDETIKHLFFECHFARTMWNLVQVATKLYPPCSISNLFNSWLRGINKDLKQLVLLRAPSVCWAIWCYRNDIVFERRNVTNIL